MADEKVIRQARQKHNLNYTFAGKAPKKVSFPIFMLLVCAAVDLVDILGYATGFGAVIWWGFTTIIFTPIVAFYLNQKEKQYQPKNIVLDYTNQNLKSGVSDFRKITRLTKESKALQDSGKTAASATKAAAAFEAKMKLPKGLKYFAFLVESVPLLELAPIFVIMVYFGYLDNVLAEKEARKSIETQLQNPKINVVD